MSIFVEHMRRPIRVMGEDIVFIPDIVGPVPLSEQHQYVELSVASNTCPTIYIRETDIEEVRESYPNVRVFGMWQTLINSGLVSYRKPLQVVETTDQDGYYIHCDLGRAEFSGDYEAGFFAADASFNLDEASSITPDIEQIVLPDTEAQLASELLAKKKDTVRKSWSGLISAATLIVICAVVVDISLNKFYSLETEKLESKTELLNVIQSGLDRLKTTRLTEVPNDTLAIERIASIWREYPRVETISNQSFQKKRISLVVTDDGGPDPRTLFSWLATSYSPKGGWSMSMEARDEK